MMGRKLFILKVSLYLKGREMGKKGEGEEGREVGREEKRERL